MEEKKDINQAVEETVDAAEEAANTEETAEAEAVQTEETAEESTEDSEEASPKKEKKDKKDELIEELNDRVKRQMAEFDNFRKRTEKEKSMMFETGAKSIIEKILPVIDNFERGLAAIPEDDKNNPFAEGMEKIYKQMLTTLTDAGVQAIEALGKEFDPNFHNAVMHIDDENYGDNIIVEEFQKGYTYRETVIRHSMVKVAN